MTERRSPNSVGAARRNAGLGLTVAVLFDALVIRILILPATMTLLGHHCWWPATSAHDTGARPLITTAANRALSTTPGTNPT
ncbi:MAG TPA: hypothetical protein VIY28_02355 [Pseudonocardiaceae bacterium]